MSSVVSFVFSTAVPGVVSAALGYELFNKLNRHLLGRRDAAFLLGGMIVSACLTPVFTHIAKNGFETRKENPTLWKIKITGLGLTQASGYATGLFFKILRPYLNRINPAFSFGYCVVQFSANAYTLYKFCTVKKDVGDNRE